MNNTIRLLSTLFVLSLFGCASEDDSDNTVLQGTWKSKEFTDSQSNKLSDIIYDFSGSNFKELYSNKNNDDTYDLDERKGSFTILQATITSESGQTVYQIDLTYDRETNIHKKDIAFIKDGELFLGSAKEAECGDDTYEVINTPTTSVNGQIISQEISTCYVRPTKLNFSQPYSKVK